MAVENTLQIGKASDVGRVRRLNEDSFGTADTFEIGWEEQKQRGTLVAVADGMGGHAAGEVASRMATETLFKTYYGARDKDPGKALSDGFAEANKAIFDVASKDATKGNMGTTLVAAVIKSGSLCAANVGDSRAYLVRGAKIRQITRDHSWVAEQVRARVLTEAQARRHVYRSVITRSIGNRPSVRPDLFRARLQSGDAIVLCSDGLSNKVEPREIQRIVSHVPDPALVAQELIALANERGGEDNITAIVVRIPSAPVHWSSVMTYLTVVSLLLLATFLAFTWLSPQVSPIVAPPTQTQTAVPAFTATTIPTEPSLVPAPTVAPTLTETASATPISTPTSSATPRIETTTTVTTTQAPAERFPATGTPTPAPSSDPAN